jgi:TRAP transporter 4TM/12TM fusion protein
MSRPILWDRLSIYVVMDTNGLLGLPLMVAAVVVFAFILMGNLLAVSGGSRFFNDLALALVGRARGGAAKIAVVSSFLFGSVSGSAVANVVASGVVTLPLMRRAGYPAKTAASIEALASTGGQLAPPIMGAAAFLMAEFLQVSYATVVLAAILPSFLYYLAIFIYVDIDASAENRALPDDIEVERASQVLLQGWVYVLPFVILLGTLFWLNWRPELSALAGAGVLALLALLVPYRGARCRLGDIVKVLPATGRSMIEILVIAAGAGLVIGALNISGLSFALTLKLAQMAEGNLFILLFVAALASIVLGMGMPTVGVYVLLASLIGPSLVKAGIDPIAAHMFLLYFGMLSMITPPVALASYTAASMTGAPPMQTGLLAVKIGWVAYLIPFVIVIEPGLVMRAPPFEIAWNFAGAVFGVYLATGAIYGYLGGPLSRVMRLLLLAAALIAILPVHVWFGVPYVGNAIAFAAGLALLWYAFRGKRAPGGGA